LDQKVIESYRRFFRREWTQIVSRTEEHEYFNTKVRKKRSAGKVFYLFPHSCFIREKSVYVRGWNI